MNSPEGVLDKNLREFREYYFQFKNKKMITNTLVVGDSIADGETAGNKNSKGWVELVDIDERFRQAVRGSTAKDWATNKNGILSKAQDTKSKNIIISLAGNDFIQSLDDEELTTDEIIDLCSNVESVVNKLKRTNTYVFLYTNPDCRIAEKQRAVEYLNLLIRNSCPEDVKFIETYKFLDKSHFNPNNIHPNILGQKEIAKQISKIVK